MLKFSEFSKDSKIRFLDQPGYPNFYIKTDVEKLYNSSGKAHPHRFELMGEQAVVDFDCLTFGRPFEVLESKTVPVIARHKHAEDADEEARKGCIACDLDKKREQGRPVERIALTVLRDVYPVQLVEQPVPPKQHKKKRWMTETYHKRIQKKWNKAVKGLTELQPARETVVINMSKVAFKAIFDKYSRGNK